MAFSHPKATLDEIEAELDRRMRHLRKELLEDLAQASNQADIRALPPEERPVCPHCGVRMSSRGKKQRRLTTSGDELLELTRSYVVCPRCQKGFFPPR